MSISQLVPLKRCVLPQYYFFWGGGGVSVLLFQGRFLHLIKEVLIKLPFN